MVSSVALNCTEFRGGLATYFDSRNLSFMFFALHKSRLSCLTLGLTHSLFQLNAFLSSFTH